MAGRQRTRDDEDPDTIEIHNHIPEGDNQRDDEGEEGDENGVIARYPASSHHVRTEGDEIVVYGRPPREGSDMSAAEANLSFDHAKTHDNRPPRTLAALNEFYRRYYPRRRTTAAR